MPAGDGVHPETLAPVVRRAASAWALADDHQRLANAASRSLRNFSAGDAAETIATSQVPVHAVTQYRGDQWCDNGWPARCRRRWSHLDRAPEFYQYGRRRGGVPPARPPGTAASGPVPRTTASAPRWPPSGCPRCLCLGRGVGRGGGECLVAAVFQNAHRVGRPLFGTGERSTTSFSKNSTDPGHHVHGLAQRAIRRVRS